jgi:hypothetical protein
LQHRKPLSGYLDAAQGDTGNAVRGRGRESTHRGVSSQLLGDRHGVDFTLREPPFVIGEVGHRRNYDTDAAGLPDNVKLGMYVYDASSGAIATPDSLHETIICPATCPVFAAYMNTWKSRS